MAEAMRKKSFNELRNQLDNMLMRHYWTHARSYRGFRNAVRQHFGIELGTPKDQPKLMALDKDLRQ